MAELPKKIGSKFGAQTLFALQHSGETCGSNGLPLTPNSIAILGRAQFLKRLKHKHLAAQLDFIRGKHERIVIVSEHYNRSLEYNFTFRNEEILQISYQILSALVYLHEFGIVHRVLAPENILLDSEGNVKLFNYGLYYITDGGKDVAFPVGKPKYTAPEVFLLSSTVQDYYSSPKADVWSLGIIISELIFKKPLWPYLKLSQCLRKVLSLVHCDDVLGRLARETDSLALFQEMDVSLRNFVEQCLIVDPRKRPTSSQLLNNPVFAKFHDLTTTANKWELPEMSKIEHPLSSWHLPELYHLWQLAGGDVYGELKKNGLIRNKSPILSIPRLVLLEGMPFGRVKDESSILDLKVVPLSLDLLVQRLAHIPFEEYYPQIEIKLHVANENGCDHESGKLPLVIREKDTEYQFQRITLFKRLLQAFPYKRKYLYDEANYDIPPLYRGKIWAALLDVKGDLENTYISVDKETAIPIDRQIEVDIPRCHQYNELLSSKSGHKKLKRILKAWVVSNPQYVYWQGLDSLCAPFLFLNFNYEARAYGCLSAFVPKYLNNFFLKDNSAVIKEYLRKFSHLIVFHDPVLANHLHDINFVPELFAIPWFLTMFSHVFPLHKIFHLWDRLLLGDSSYPLFIGFAILQQLRDTLLSSGFNECILLFSDLPDVDIEKCVSISTDLWLQTPKSITFRKYQLSKEDKSEFTVTDTDIAEIHKEYCPRINNTDLLLLINSKYTRSDVLVIDIRPNEEFSDGAILGSINVPYSCVNFNESYGAGIPLGPELSIMINNKGKLCVVIGSNPSESAQFCEYLAQGEFPKVCSLHGGISALHNNGVLVPVIT